jgi:hypothetical protein
MEEGATGESPLPDPNTSDLYLSIQRITKAASMRNQLAISISYLLPSLHLLEFFGELLPNRV